jgi:hypothetical protein
VAHKRLSARPFFPPFPPFHHPSLPFLLNGVGQEAAIAVLQEQIHELAVAVQAVRFVLPGWAVKVAVGTPLAHPVSGTLPLCFLAQEQRAAASRVLSATIGSQCALAGEEASSLPAAAPAPGLQRPSAKRLTAPAMALPYSFPAPPLPGRP